MSTTLRPDVRLRQKLYVMVLFWGFVSVALCALMGVGIGADAGGPRGALIGFAVTVGINLLWLVPALIVIAPYYRSLQYEIQDDEVIVRAGVITKSVKHVPFRTVTNLEVKRGPFDRLFGIGTVNIQTAGMSGQQGAEESLIGLPNYGEVYEQVAAALRRFRGALPPTQAGAEPAPATPDSQTLAAILDELRAIRRAVEK